MHRTDDLLRTESVQRLWQQRVHDLAGRQGPSLPSLSAFVATKTVDRSPFGVLAAREGCRVWDRRLDGRQRICWRAARLQERHLHDGRPERLGDVRHGQVPQGKACIGPPPPAPSLPPSCKAVYTLAMNESSLDVKRSPSSAVNSPTMDCSISARTWALSNPCPKRHPSLVRAASTVMSYPGVTPTSRRATPVA